MTRSSAFTASLSVPERAAYGRDARKRASRSCHGWFEADADAGRTDPIEVIERQSATRLQEWSRSATAACSNPRSASTGARRRSWRRTSGLSPTPA